MYIESSTNADGYVPNSSLFGPWIDSPTQVKYLRFRVFRENSEKCELFEENFKVKVKLFVNDNRDKVKDNKKMNS